MIIDRIELLTLTIPFVREFAISSSAFSSCTHILVKVCSGDLVGWGECASPSGPYYCEETVKTCHPILEHFLAPAVLGKSWETIDDFQALYARIKRNHFAKAGLETAAQDLLAKSRSMPLWSMLGGTRSEVFSGVSLGIQQDTTELIRLIDGFLEQGYRRIKLKIGPGKDAAVLREVRKSHPDVPLTADANSAYTLSDIEMLRRLDEFGLLMIEQPLAHDDIIDHAQLQAAVETPICLDESIHTVDDARHAIDLGSCRIINIKVSRVGGLQNAKAIHDYCHAHDIPVWCGGMHEFGVGRAHNLAIATLPGFSLAGDVCGFDKDYADDITTPLIRAQNGSHTPSLSTGLGFEVDEEKLARYCVSRVAVEGAQEVS